MLPLTNNALRLRHRYAAAPNHLVIADAEILAT